MEARIRYQNKTSSVIQIVEIFRAKVIVVLKNRELDNITSVMQGKNFKLPQPCRNNSSALAKRQL